MTHFSFCPAKPYRERLDDIDTFFETNPGGYEIAERILSRSACRTQDEPDLFGEELMTIWIGEVITLEQAAHLSLPLMSEVFGWKGNARERFGAWVKTWLLDRGLDREKAIEILKSHQASERRAS